MTGSKVVGEDREQEGFHGKMKQVCKTQKERLLPFVSQSPSILNVSKTFLLII